MALVTGALGTSATGCLEVGALEVDDGGKTGRFVLTKFFPVVLGTAGELPAGGEEADRTPVDVK